MLFTIEALVQRMSRENVVGLGPCSLPCNDRSWRNVSTRRNTWISRTDARWRRRLVLPIRRYVNRLGEIKARSRQKLYVYMFTGWIRKSFLNLNHSVHRFPWCKSYYIRPLDTSKVCPLLEGIIWVYPVMRSQSQKLYYYRMHPSMSDSKDPPTFMVNLSLFVAWYQ